MKNYAHPSFKGHEIVRAGILPNLRATVHEKRVKCELLASQGRLFHWVAAFEMHLQLRGQVPNGLFKLLILIKNTLFRAVLGSLPDQIVGPRRGPQCVNDQTLGK